MASVSAPEATASDSAPDPHLRTSSTQRRVCKVAAELFNERGFGSVSVETLISEADIARSTFYRLFRDKNDLFRHIAVPVFEQARRHLEAIDSDNPESIVAGIAQSYLAVWQDRKSELILASNCGSGLFPLVEQHHNAYANVLLLLMRRLHEVRLLRHDDERLAAVMLVQTAVPILKVCERHPHFGNVFTSTLRGMLLKW